MAVHINPAQFPADCSIIHALFSAYAASLGIDLTFQSFQEELESIPGKYATGEGGALLIARTDGNLNSTPQRHAQKTGGTNTTLSSNLGNAIGCVALRRNVDGWSEMKRLYVLPEARGLQLGDKLVEAIIAHAKALGYRGIRLDTLPDMRAARRLYGKHGFVETQPYYDTPLPNTIFLACEFGENSNITG